MYSPRPSSDAALQEALRLAETLEGADCPHLTIGPHAVRAATYIGRGSVERVAEEAQSIGADKIFLNAVLTAGGCTESGRGSWNSHLCISASLSFQGGTSFPQRDNNSVGRNVRK